MKNLQRKTKIRFLLVILVLTTFVGFLDVTVENVSAAEMFADQEVVINSEWFSSTPVEFGGNEIEGGKYDRLNIDEGGEGMTEFINHGEVGYDEDTETHVYMATMTFPFYYCWYTDCYIGDVYGHHYEENSDDWLDLYLSEDAASSDLGLPAWDHDHYAVKWNDIVIDWMNPQIYDGATKIHTKISPNLPVEEGDIITIDGLEFKIPDIRIYTKEVILTERNYGVCDDPQNFYLEEGDVQIGIRDSDISDLYGVTNFNYQEGSDDQIEDDCDDGWDENENDDHELDTAKEIVRDCGLEDIITYYGVTFTSSEIGQGFASSPCVGTTWGQTDDLNNLDEEFDFLCNIRLKPNIFYDMQTFEIEEADIWVDTKDEWDLTQRWNDYYGLWKVRDYNTEVYKRIIGLGVQNLFIKMKFEASVVMLLAVEPLGDESEEFLEDPEIKQSDIIWDNTFTGTKDATIVGTKESNPLEAIEDWINDVGDWISSIPEWFADALGGITDWLSDIGDWWSKYWWILVIIALVIVVIIVFLLIRRIFPKKRYREIRHVTSGPTRNYPSR